jgi:hypothetical protein
MTVPMAKLLFFQNLEKLPDSGGKSWLGKSSQH